MSDTNDIQGCRVGFELSCANCGQVVSCERDSGDLIARELIGDAELGFAELLAALIMSGWDIQVHQLVIDGNPRLILMGQPVDKYGRPDMDKHDVTAIWERRPTGWVAGTGMSGFQRIQGGVFRPCSARELAGLVAQNTASWVRIPAPR